MAGITDLRTSEQNALRSNDGQSLFSGSGRPSISPKAKLTRRKSGLAAMIVSFALMAVGGTLLGSTHTLLGAALPEKFTEALNYQEAASAYSKLKIGKIQLSGENGGGWTSPLSRLSNKFKDRLSRSGFNVNGNSVSYQGQSINGSDLTSLYRNNTGFRSDFNQATLSKAGNFYDTAANTQFARVGTTRNLYKDYEQTGNSDIDMENFRDTVNTKFDNQNSTDITTTHEDPEYVYEIDENGNSHIVTDENGNPVVTHDTVKQTGSAVTTNQSIDEATAKAEQFTSSIASNVSSKLERISNSMAWGCTALQIGNLVAIAVMANEIYQSIQYFMSFMEPSSKMQSGNGNESPINEVLNTLVTPYDTTIDDYTNYSVSGSIDSKNLSINIGTYSMSGSMVESPSTLAILSNTPINTTEAEKFSIERITNPLLSTMATALTSTNAIKTCNRAQGVSAAISLGISIVPFIGSVKIVGGMIWQGIKQIGWNLIVSFGVTTLLSFMIPAIAKTMFTNVFEDLKGKAAGEELARGGSASLSKLSRAANGLGLASKEAVLEYNQANNEILALNAEVERYRRSPFDITSSHTFLGSIIHSLLPSVLSSGATSVKTLLSTTSSSIAQLTGSVSAAGEGSNYMTTFGDCTQLAEIGAACSVHGIATPAGDVSTFELSPATDTVYRDKIQSQLENCDSDGFGCTIKKNSDLAKYISYCNLRESPDGIPDSNIMNEIQASNGISSVLGGVLSSILGSAPFASDVITILDSFTAEAYFDWTNSQKCVNNPETNPDWDTDIKYYAAYVSDMRQADQFGVFEDDTENAGSSPVTAFVNEYYAEHPLDTTPAGTLARISGMTKDDAELVLDVIAYYQFLETYDPETRIAMDGNTSDISDSATIIAQIESKRLMLGEGEATQPEVALLDHHIIYADIRNRSYTV